MEIGIDNLSSLQFAISLFVFTHIPYPLQSFFQTVLSIIICKKSLKLPKGGNQNPHIEEEQTKQWPKEKGQQDKQRSTKHTLKAKDRVTRTPLKTGDELRCSERVSSSCSTTGSRRINLVTNPVISRE